jgi:hypothetical protein
MKNHCFEGVNSSLYSIGYVVIIFNGILVYIQIPLGISCYQLVVYIRIVFALPLTGLGFVPCVSCATGTLDSHKNESKQSVDMCN